MQSGEPQDDTGPPSTPPDSVDAVFARRLRDVRGIAGLTQQQLADRMTAAGYKMFRSQIGKIENGDRPVTVGEATVLAAALGVELTELLTDPSQAGQENELQARRLAMQVAVKTLAEQAKGHLKLMNEQKLLYEDTCRQLEVAKQRLAGLSPAKIPAGPRGVRGAYHPPGRKDDQ